MSGQAAPLMYTQADLDAARRAATRAALNSSRAEVAELRRIVDVARQAVAARDRFCWSPEADAAIGRLREILGPR